MCPPPRCTPEPVSASFSHWQSSWETGAPRPCLDLCPQRLRTPRGEELGFRDLGHLLRDRGLVSCERPPLPALFSDHCWKELRPRPEAASLGLPQGLPSTGSDVSPRRLQVGAARAPAFRPGPGEVPAPPAASQGHPPGRPSGARAGPLPAQETRHPPEHSGSPRSPAQEGAAGNSR